MKTARQLHAASKSIRATSATNGPQGSPNPKPLPSQQWASESTLALRAAEADPPNDSASGTGGPDDCTGTFIPSPRPKERPLVHDETPPAGEPDDYPGGSGYLVRPYPVETEVMCDGKAKVRRGRVVSCFFQLHVYLGKAPHRITKRKIERETRCRELQKMLDDLNTLKGYAGGHPEMRNLRQPSDFIKKHEDVHLALYRESVNARYATLVATVEALTEPCSTSRGDAEKAMAKALKDARDAFEKGIKDDETNNGNHIPAKRFSDASAAATAQWIADVTERMRGLGCFED